MVVALTAKNESFLVEVKALHKVKTEREVDKQELKRLKEMNAKLKVEVHSHQMRERLLMWGSVVSFCY